MRTLTGNLSTNQKSPIERPPLVKLVLTKSGQATQTYGVDTTNRLRFLSHIEQEWSQAGRVAVHSDATLAALSLHGYTGTISYGYNDITNGDEYSAAAPLEVIGQNTDTLLNRDQATLITTFRLVGGFDLMAAETASEKHTQNEENTDTVKTLLTKIAEATLPCFSHCKAFTITFDDAADGDFAASLVNTYIPADYFYIAVGESRLSAFRKLIRTTKSKARIEDDGEIHIFWPLLGPSLDYQYKDEVLYHNFFQKATRQRLVIPTKWIVSSHPSHENQYTGSATDTASETALGRSIPRPRYIRATSNTQCDNIAAALLQHGQVAAQTGHGLFPMNCGQEVMDYIEIVDSVASDTVQGTVGYLRREYVPGSDFLTELRFGGIAGGLDFAGQADPDARPTYDDLNALADYHDETLLLLAQWVLEQQEVIPKLWVPIRMAIPAYGENP